MGEFTPTDNEVLQLMQNRLRNMEQQKKDIEIGLALSERMYARDHPGAMKEEAQAKAQVSEISRGITELEKMIEEHSSKTNGATPINRADRRAAEKVK